MGVSVVVRPRVEGDLSDLVAALARVHQVDGYPVHARNVTASWLSPDGLQGAWTATVDGRPAGHIVLDRTGAGLAVARLFVDTTDRGCGLADLLLDAVQAAAGSEPLTLEVHISATAAIARYERRGWVRTGIHDAAWTEANGTPARAYSYRAPASRTA